MAFAETKHRGTGTPSMTSRVTIVASVCIALSMLASRSDAQETTLSRVAWLTGCWAFTDGDRSVEENWMAPRGGVMIASGRTVRAGALAGYELVVLREQEGRLRYEAHPSDQPMQTFTSTTIGEASILFENPQHDFPQRVGYERRGDTLHAWIEGTMAGQNRRLEFPFRRVACDQR